MRRSKLKSNNFFLAFPPLNTFYLMGKGKCFDACNRNLLLMPARAGTDGDWQRMSGYALCFLKK
jgi:hypothetical protein